MIFLWSKLLRLFLICLLMEEHRELTPTAIVSEKLFSVEMIIAAPWNCFSLEDASAEHEYAFGHLLHFLPHFRSVSATAKADIDILEQLKAFRGVTFFF